MWHPPGAPGVGTPNSSLPAAIQVNETQFKVVASFVGIGKQVYDCNAGTARSCSVSRSPGLLSLGGSGGDPRQGSVLGELRRLTREWEHYHSSCVPTSVPGLHGSDENVPWLKVTGDPVGNSGVFSKVAFIQRIDTRGGVMPTGTCTTPKTVAVDYTANYVFWAPK